MKRNVDRQKYLTAKNAKKNKKQFFQASRHKHRKIRRIIERRKSADRELTEKERLRKYKRIKKQVAKEIHSNFRYNQLDDSVSIVEEFGIEGEDFRDKFLETASKCIDFDCMDFHIDISNATFMWPSSITLLCSLRQWIEIGLKFHGNKYKPPRISSNNSKRDEVTSYLEFCGFHKYVNRQPPLDGKYKNIEYDELKIIKLERENDNKNWNKKVEEINGLLRRFNIMNEDEIELFDNIILQETFSNVTEHGFSYKDDGWWMMCQYHEQHKFISLCIADNGIGFKNTLINGPQKESFDEADGEGDLIKKSLEYNVSGAYDADIKESSFLSYNEKYPIGDRRGQGLKRIRQYCKELEIAFSILSHYGYLFVDSDGKITDFGSKPNRVFGGTMYNYIIPDRKRKK